MTLYEGKEGKKNSMRHVDVRTQAKAVVEQAWSLLGQAHLREARAMSEQLVQDILDQLEAEQEESTEGLQELVSACYVAGYTVGMSVRDSETLMAVSYFEEMLRAARKLKDDSSCVIALTYQGNCYRRYGDFNEALRCLQTAYATQQTDQAAHGNCAQVLGRLYLQMDEEEHFARVMKEAEHLARSIEPVHPSLHGQYGLETVFLEYSQHYGKRGETAKALDSLAQAKESLPDLPHWHTLLTATHGLLLVQNGQVEHGMPFVLEAVKLALEQGYACLLEHFDALQNNLARKTIAWNQATVRLGESLHGPLAE